MSDPKSIWRKTLANLHTWKRGDRRAVHKPLLTLILIARAASNRPQEIRFREIKGELTRLLKEFGPPRKNHHPEHPFWHLQTDGFWVIKNLGDLAIEPGQSPSQQDLLKREIVGAVPQELWHALKDDPDLRAELTLQLLDAFWPPTLHNAIRQAIGLPEAVEQVGKGMIRRIQRDPRFRENVLRAYTRRCAVCGYDGRLADVLLGIEAAHIQWHAYQGPDDVSNGVALCSFHHVALDSGALGIAPDFRILISCDVNGQTLINDYLYRFSGRKLFLPQASFPKPAQTFLTWHQKEVFRHPARHTENDDQALRFQLAAEHEEDLWGLEGGKKGIRQNP